MWRVLANLTHYQFDGKTSAGEGISRSVHNAWSRIVHCERLPPPKGPGAREGAAQGQQPQAEPREDE